jgi:sensor histidine kinase YesM
MSELKSSIFISKFSRQRLAQHFLFWIAAVVLYCSVFGGPFTMWQTIINALGFLPGHMIFVYSIIYFLLPRFILKGKIYAAILIFIAILCISLLYMRLADLYFLHYSGYPGIWSPSIPRSIFALFGTGWIAVSIKLFKYWWEEKEVQQKLEKEKLTAELNLLKSQLHPHFLFNTLNNLYSLTLERSAQAPQALLKLASLLRYVLYECNEPSVLLMNEINLLKDYIELERLRYGDRIDVSMSFTGEIENKKIAPLLLLPFVENCFKHGTSEQLETCWISLDLRVEKDALSFKLINSKNQIGDSADIKKGLGLDNVQKRLNLLYPGKFKLKVTPDEETFMVSLVIDLSILQEPVQQKHLSMI